jgi:hypothetical protein
MLWHPPHCDQVGVANLATERTLGNGPIEDEHIDLVFACKQRQFYGTKCQQKSSPVSIGFHSALNVLSSKGISRACFFLPLGATNNKGREHFGL